MSSRPADYPLNGRQYELLDAMVQTPSWFVAPNDVHRRMPGDERDMLDMLDEYVRSNSDATVHRVSGGTKGSVDPYKRASVFAERGTLTEPAFTMLFYAHIDTVYPDAFPGEWHNPLHLTVDGDTLAGLGVYDMKAGAMAAIDAFSQSTVPEGMRLQLALCHDEEMESFGALDLIEWLKETGRVPDLILSPEIATLMSRRSERDSPKDVVANRIGHVKSLMRIIVPQAHRFDRGALDAERELHAARIHLEAFFTRNRRTHRHFGKHTEDLAFTEYHVPRARGFSNTTNGSMRMSYLNVPGHSVKEVLRWESDHIHQCAKIRDWTRKGAQLIFTQTPGETSYEPYALNASLPVAQAVLRGVAETYGGYKLKGGGSTSDANVFNALLPDTPCFDIGPVGGKAHNREEWVSAASVAKNIEWLRQMVERHIPRFLEAKK